MSNPQLEIQLSHPDVVSFPAISDDQLDLNDHLAHMRSHHPQVTPIIANLRAISPGEMRAKISALQACSEFSERGRGLQWATTTEQHLGVRRSGASALLGAAECPGQAASDFYLLDVFGGAGFIAQFARDIFNFGGIVVTSDPSPIMVRLTRQKGFPALWQRAQDLFMTRSNSVDAVLFAYGTHHVPPPERLQSFREAWRVLKPGGTLIFHDFEAESSPTRWFQEVVDPYTVTGHQHEHFTVKNILRYFEESQFEVKVVSTIDDCFQFAAPTKEAARVTVIEFMGGAYGLENLPRSKGTMRFLWSKLEEIFSIEEFADDQMAGGQQVVVHRPALLCVGQKPI